MTWAKLKTKFLKKNRFRTVFKVFQIQEFCDSCKLKSLVKLTKSINYNPKKICILQKSLFAKYYSGMRKNVRDIRPTEREYRLWIMARARNRRQTWNLEGASCYEVSCLQLQMSSSWEPREFWKGPQWSGQII